MKIRVDNKFMSFSTEKEVKEFLKEDYITNTNNLSDNKNMIENALKQAKETRIFNTYLYAKKIEEEKLNEKIEGDLEIEVNGEKRIFNGEDELKEFIIKDYENLFIYFMEERIEYKLDSYRKGKDILTEKKILNFSKSYVHPKKIKTIDEIDEKLQLNLKHTKIIGIIIAIMIVLTIFANIMAG